MMSSDLHNAISLQELVDGVSRLPLRDGLVTSLYGPVPAPVSPSVWPVKDSEPRMIVISGLSSAASLRTADLQRSLESRLRQQMDVNGSPEYVLTWKQWDMESGPPICALRASQRRISDKDYTGWPTPTNSMMTEQDLTQAMTAGNGTGRKTYAESLIFHGWVTPSTRDYKDTSGMSLTGTNPDGSTRMRIDQLPRQAEIAGQTTLSFHVETAKRGVLNPDLPLWLMGYPEEWGLYADTVTRFARK